MALILSPIIASGSGSIAGLVISRNAGGLYIRAKAIPINPNTPAQIIVRTAVATLTNLWVNVLTQVERDAWDLYAFNTPLTGPLGAPRTVSGLAMYIRGNVSRIQAGLALANAAPTIFDLGDFTAISAWTPAGATDIVAFNFTITDDWVNEDGASMLVYIGRPQNPSVVYFTGPYQLAGQLDGDAVTPPTSPAAITSTFAFAAGQQIFGRVVVTRADGRLSTTQRQSALAL